MKKRIGKKLSLSKETLRHLSASEIGNAVGGNTFTGTCCSGGMSSCCTDDCTTACTDGCTTTITQNGC